MSKEELSKLFVKVCTNQLPAIDLRHFKATKEKRPAAYKRAELCTWAKEAFDRGENVFYVNTTRDGKVELAKPKYEYMLIRNLSVEEYLQLFSE